MLLLAGLCTVVAISRILHLCCRQSSKFYYSAVTVAHSILVWLYNHLMAVKDLTPMRLPGVDRQQFSSL